MDSVSSGCGWRAFLIGVCQPFEFGIVDTTEVPAASSPFLVGNRRSRLEESGVLFECEVDSDS